MSKTLEQILISVNSVLDLEAQLPTGDELLTRANYANQAVFDASAKAQLPEFKREYLTSTSSLATIPLPSNFRELQDTPRIYTNGGWEEWEAIEIEQKYDKSSGDRYCYVMGNPSEGYNLIFNNIIPSDQLSVIYQRYPSGLATLTDVCEIADPQAVVRKVESYVMYARSDDRFPTAEARSESQFANMVGRSMKGTKGGARETKMTFKHPLQWGA